jgi:hypothetical protein
METYLYKVALVALITRGNETVDFAFDLILLVVLFWKLESSSISVPQGDRGAAEQRVNIPHKVRTTWTSGF